MSTTAPEPYKVTCSCPVCGVLTLPVADVRLLLCATDPDRTTYQFTCPKCTELVTKQASERVVTGLMARGVPHQRIPAEALEPRRGGAPLTTNDVLDFLIDLADDAAVAAAVEVLRAGGGGTP